MAPKASSKIARKRSSLLRSSSSAVIRAVLSMLMPTIFTERPALSLTTLAREEIQRISPSGRKMRKSYSLLLPLAMVRSYIAFMASMSSAGRCGQKSSLRFTGQP
ncbi:hypothetical protein D3C76_1622470 [compost metagenome]